MDKICNKFIYNRVSIPFKEKKTKMLNDYNQNISSRIDPYNTLMKIAKILGITLSCADVINPLYEMQH